MVIALLGSFDAAILYYEECLFSLIFHISLFNVVNVKYSFETLNIINSHVENNFENDFIFMFLYSMEYTRFISSLPVPVQERLLADLLSDTEAVGLDIQGVHTMDPTRAIMLVAMMLQAKMLRDIQAPEVIPDVFSHLEYASNEATQGVDAIKGTTPAPVTNDLPVEGQFDDAD